MAVKVISRTPMIRDYQHIYVKFYTRSVSSGPKYMQNKQTLLYYEVKCREIAANIKINRLKWGDLETGQNI